MGQISILGPSHGPTDLFPSGMPTLTSTSSIFCPMPKLGNTSTHFEGFIPNLSSCNKNTKTTTLLLQHIGSLITVIFLHYILQEFCSGLPRLSKNKSTMWYAKRLVTITKYFFMVKIRTKQSLLGFQKWSHDFTLALRCKMSNRALPKAQRTQVFKFY